MKDCTYLFEEEQGACHASESFWTSVVALQILEVSKRGTPLSIPTFTYEADEERWVFRPEGSILIPSGLDRSSVIVEGVFKDGFLKDLGERIPNEFRNLKPDITIILPEKEVWLIEVKTVGSTVGGQKQERELLADFLNSRGFQAIPFFLLSAGHPHDPDWQMFNRRLSGLSKSKLLLWEQLLKAIDKQVSDSVVSRCLGDLCAYYRDEGSYMSGRFQAIG